VKFIPVTILPVPPKSNSLNNVDAKSFRFRGAVTIAALLGAIQLAERDRTLVKHQDSSPPRSIGKGRTNQFGFAPPEYRLRPEDFASRWQ
jgi:hypothetical protein